MSMRTTARGKFRQLTGRAKTTFGRMTGNHRMQASGYKDRLEGGAKQVPHKIRRAIR
jgi:uncharacterized protein YjbJ (UPF0337 family)